MVWLTDAVVVRVGGGSNVRYVGVTQSTFPERTLEEIQTDLVEAQRLGARMVVLVGGEPLVRKDFVGVLRALLERRLVPGVATNGRMLAYNKVRELISRAKVGFLRVELHGPNAAIHDTIVGVDGAFDQTFEGIRRLLLEGSDSLRLEVACTVVAANLEHLSHWVDSLVVLPRRVPMTLRFVAPLGTITKVQWPPSREVSRRVGEALALVQRAGADVTAAWEGFAPCLLEEHAHVRDELIRCGCPVMGPRGGAAIPLEPPDERSHPFPCQECVHETTCPGAPKGLILEEGEGVLRPTRRLRANSFNYELRREIHPFRLEPGQCTARELDWPQGTVRSLLLVRDDVVSLYESPTSDFGEEEIGRVKDDLEQVYLDTSPGAALDDFMTHVRRLRFDSGCPTCPDRPSCCGAMRVDPEPPFVREERWLAKEVSRLRGRVLDVGCGDSLYRDELRALIANGEIEYHGLDPDASSLDRMRQQKMGGTLHHGEIETFTFESGYFDYVLVLRSLNHFRDMERALAVISRVLRIHGQMVLCDSPPFAMLRTTGQVAFADENAPVGHEHYRNWNSHQVLEFLKRFPFRVDVHRPISNKTSNQWIVKVMRMSDGVDRALVPENRS